MSRIQTKTIAIVQHSIDGGRNAYVSAIDEGSFEYVVGCRPYLGFYPGAGLAEACDYIRRGYARTAALVCGGVSLYK